MIHTCTPRCAASEIRFVRLFSRLTWQPNRLPAGFRAAISHVSDWLVAVLSIPDGCGVVGDTSCAFARSGSCERVVRSSTV